LARAGCTIEYLHEVLGTFRVHEQSFTAKIQQHCENLLNLLNCHFDHWQEKTLYSRYLMRKRRADAWRGGARACLKKGEHHQARRLLLLAWKEDPLSWKTWVLSAMNLFRVRSRIGG